MFSLARPAAPDELVGEPGLDGLERYDGGDTRYARPWRPVKPLLTICAPNARSALQVPQRRVSGLLRDSREGRTGTSMALALAVGASSSASIGSWNSGKLFGLMGLSGLTGTLEGLRGELDAVEAGELESDGTRGGLPGSSGDAAIEASEDRFRRKLSLRLGRRKVGNWEARGRSSGALARH